MGVDHQKPWVLLPGLSPRSLSLNEEGEHSLFWERFRQLERLLAGAYWLNQQDKEKEDYEGIPRIGIVCIDSLNTFGDRPLTREELCRLFDLFRHYKVLGICTVESGLDPELMSSSDLVDILIRLHAENTDGYFMRYFEIAKSRNQHQRYGLHPFKIRSQEEVDTEKKWGKQPKACEHSPTLFQAVKIFPSIHTVILATERKDN